jgi:hypothetical protein
MGNLNGGNVGKSGTSTSRLPKLNFTEIWGDNPRLWVSRCENYFDMYEVDECRWIQIASMSFTDAAARWFQSVETKLRHASWQEFIIALLDHFGREQKEVLIRQLFHIKQNGTMVDYVGKFARLVDQLTAYGHVTEPVYYAMHFVDGLRDDNRVVVSLHHPSTFDTSASLALLQDDLGSQFKASRKQDSTFGSRIIPRGPNPLSSPPRIDKNPTPVLLEEKKLCEGKSPEEQMVALRTYRRAKGLCIRCAEKWYCEHKCATTVQLHVVQELLELFNLEDVDDLSMDSEAQDQLFVALSREAISGKKGPRTMRLEGLIQGKEAIILVDSGSSTTFIDQEFAKSLNCVPEVITTIQVQVANGHTLHCSSTVRQLSWSMDNYKFTSDMNVLPLAHFDIILGMDWLEAYSPMQVHWKHKWMAIPYKGTTTILQGITPIISEEIIVHICHVEQLSAFVDNVVSPEVSAILDDFDVVFEPLSTLPPKRSCDHVIPLIPGAKLVHIRPYRYPPALKDEIEKQAREMLDKGIIQPSSSAFSSPVLLVRKKDGSWRFCIDYICLNALTRKSKFPIRVFDQLMDELAVAKWFSTLDLNSGYHQIRLKSGEEF